MRTSRPSGPMRPGRMRMTPPHSPNVTAQLACAKDCTVPARIGKARKRALRLELHRARLVWIGTVPPRFSWSLGSPSIRILHALLHTTTSDCKFHSSGGSDGHHGAAGWSSAQIHAKSRAIAAALIHPLAALMLQSRKCAGINGNAYS